MKSLDDRGAPFDRSSFYGVYSAHKRWGGGDAVGDVDRYSVTFGRLGLEGCVAILEIGFGEGRFLDWAKRRGHTAEGVEILPEMVDHARTRGHVVHLGPVHQLEQDGPRFDLIVAFDVIEHLTLSEILDLLNSADRLLKDGGRIVIQFPNAGSPFSALYQSGDVTHRCALSADLLQQICPTRGWAVSQYFNARVTSSRFVKRLKWIVAHRVRDLLELIFGFAYYGIRCPLDPNIVVVLERCRPTWSDATLASKSHSAS
jgi:SAM-dependent methyltransferase